MRLPKTWTKLTAGHYRHPETGIEIRKSGGEWGIIAPGRTGTRCYAAAVASAPTLTAAVEDADERWIPRVRAEIAQSFENAHWERAGGRPRDWENGQADTDTVLARQDAVTATGTPNGYTAEPGQIVRQIETGEPAIFVRYGPGAACAYARFAGDTTETLVHAADLVVITDPIGCRRHATTAHAGHEAATTPECLIEEPDAELDGAELAETRPGRYQADDGVIAEHHADGTWSAYGPGRYGVDYLCSRQPRLTATYRWINEYRTSIAVQIAADHAAATAIEAARAAATIPSVISLPVALLSTFHYGMEIHDGFGGWHQLISVGPVDPDTGRSEITVAARPRVRLHADLTVQLRPAARVWHRGEATDAHGTPIRDLPGTLYYGAAEDDDGPHGTWTLTSFGNNSKIDIFARTRAQRWAADLLAGLGLGTVAGWQEHRDSIGQAWTPYYSAPGDAPNGPGGPAGPGPDAARTRTSDAAQTTRKIATAPVRATTIAFNYITQTQTDGVWATTQTGQTPPTLRRTQTAADLIAQTILGNTGPFPGPGDAWTAPPARVTVWNTETGLRAQTARA